MSEYKTIKETAEAWGVSRRYVNLCIEAGRIPGAVKRGNQWLIPPGAEKPSRAHRPRQAQNTLSSQFAHVLAEISIPTPQDYPDAILDGVRETRVRYIHEGALAYARGDFARAIQCYRQNEGDEAAKLCASSIALVAAISLGEHPVYLEIEAFLKGIVEKYASNEVSAYAQLALSGGYLGGMVPSLIPDWLKNGDFSVLPAGAKPDAAYKRAKYYQCIGDHKSSLITAQMARSLCCPEGEISFPCTYLTLLAAAACFALEQVEEAEQYLLMAMRMNLPSGFITPLVEYLPLFGGLMERLLEREYPESLAPIRNQWGSTFNNWISFHNQLTKDNITSILSLREYQLALLVSRRVPYAQIAKFHGISVSRLKAIMQVVYDKLYVNNREELSEFIL